MNSRPLVTNVIIFLNAENFIEEAIESVFAQTYNNWELLLVDDGSTDDSTRIALRYVERYPERVHYLEHPGHRNQGMSASRNLGINYAKGEYIGFLDADDVWLEHKLEQQVAILSSRPEVGMVYGSSLYWFGWTGNPEDSRRDFRDFVEECGVKPNTLIEPTELLRVFLRRDRGNTPCVFGSVPCTCSVLVRSEVAERVGGFERSFEGMYEDQAFYVKVGLEVPVFAASECWSKYRRHPSSTTYNASETDQHISTRLFFLNWVAEYLFKQRINDAEIWKLLQEEQLRTHNRQLKKLERALRKERRTVRRLTLRVQRMDRWSQDEMSPEIRKPLMGFVDRLRAKVLGK